MQHGACVLTTRSLPRVVQPWELLSVHKRRQREVHRMLIVRGTVHQAARELADRAALALAPAVAKDSVVGVAELRRRDNAPAVKAEKGRDEVVTVGATPGARRLVTRLPPPERNGLRSSSPTCACRAAYLVTALDVCV